jgi:hypothetical protein
MHLSLLLSMTGPCFVFRRTDVVGANTSSSIVSRLFCLKAHDGKIRKLISSCSRIQKLNSFFIGRCGCFKCSVKGGGG